MGSGIALAALLADLRVTLYDISPEMLDKAQTYVEKHLDRKRKAINIKFLRMVSDLAELREAELIIEAAPEDLDLKQSLFAQLDEICRPPAILATNTSTLSVTAIAAAARHPERVAGMHFFNPAPVLPLVEVVRAAQTSPDVIQAVVSLAEKMGKAPVVTADTPGFIVNRVARPFYGEALRLLGEGVASHQEIDRLVRRGAGFRMGPFELMDLIGLDVNLAATQSIFNQTFFEPRYRPHRIQVQMVAQKSLGRKAGRGFYSYDGDGRPGEDKAPVKPAALLQGTVQVSPGSWAPGLMEVLQGAGLSVLDRTHQAVEEPIGQQLPPLLGILAAGRREGLRKLLQGMDADLPPDIPILCPCVDITLAEAASWVDHPERLAGFDGLSLSMAQEAGRVITLVASPFFSAAFREAVEVFITSLGYEPVWVADSPGLILPRILCMLANEAAFAASEGVADPDTIDRAMQLGTNYPFGPLAWAKTVGYAQVVDVLDHLVREFGEERYRTAPYLRSMARLTK
jgi:3-hydroxybutyryl-CoA dehydrogenase